MPPLTNRIHTPSFQVLVLGAGFDTAWFQLHQDLPPGQMPVKYLEVDFKEVGAWGEPWDGRHETRDGPYVRRGS